MCRPSYICKKCKDNSSRSTKINIAKKLYMSAQPMPVRLCGLLLFTFWPIKIHHNDFAVALGLNFHALKSPFFYSSS